MDFWKIKLAIKLYFLFVRLNVFIYFNIVEFIFIIK